MPNLKDIHLQIENLNLTRANKLGIKREIKYLPEILMENELILGLTNGFESGHKWLIVCTNRRIVFLDKRLFFGLRQKDILIDKISSVSQESHLVFGKIIISEGTMNTVIGNIPQNTVKAFVNAINKSIDTSKMRSSHFGSSEIDIASQLHKLAELKEKGLITEMEFNIQKKKLMN